MVNGADIEFYIQQRRAVSGIQRFYGLEQRRYQGDNCSGDDGDV